MEFLTDIPLFDTLNEEQEKILAGAAARKRIAMGEVFCREGAEANFFAVLVRGLAKASLFGADGSECLLDFYFPGDAIGEMNVSDLVHYPFNLTTLEPSELLLVARPALIKIMKSNSELAYRLNSATVRRALVVQQRLRSLALEEGRQRILTFLSEIAQRRSQSVDNGLAIDYPISHKMIADACGLSRETVSRLTAKLAADGLLLRRGEGWWLALPGN